MSFELGFTKVLPNMKAKTKKKKVSKKKMNVLQKSFHVIKDDEADVDEFISERIDPILEKIAQDGLSSLTAEERKLLEKIGAALL